MKSPDEVFEEFSSNNVSLNIVDKGDYVLLEGNREALLFLSELIKAQALSEKDCGFQLMVDGPGNRFFSSESDKGIYIHVKPHEKCEHE